MSVRRMRAYVPEVSGAVAAVALTAASVIVSRLIGAVVPLHAHRISIVGLCLASVAAIVSIVLLIVVVVAHVRQFGATAIVEAVVARRTVFRRSASYFLLFLWPFAFAVSVLGILSR
jgi:hypothetical protein